MAQLIHRAAALRETLSIPVIPVRHLASFSNSPVFVETSLPFSAHKVARPSCFVATILQEVEVLKMTVLWDLLAILVCENNHNELSTPECRGGTSHTFYERGVFLSCLKMDDMDVHAVKQVCQFTEDHVLKNKPVILLIDTCRYHGSKSDLRNTLQTHDDISGLKQDTGKEIRKDVNDAIPKAKSLGADRKEMRNMLPCVGSSRTSFLSFGIWTAIYKGGIFSKPLLSATFYSLHSQGVRYLSNLIKPADRRINFEHLFNACTTSEAARRVQALLIVSGKAQSIFYVTRLVNKYSHLGNVSLARDTFDQVSRKDSYTWNSMLSAYVRNSRFNEAIKCAFEMLSSTDVRPDFYTFPPILKACRSLHDGALFHCWVLKLGFEWDVFVAASLVHMYSRFGYASHAHTIFKDMPFRDMGCWNSMISGFFQTGNQKEALSVFYEMIQRGIAMDTVTVSTILAICAQINDSLLGMLIHLFAIKHGLEFNIFVSNALINMYAKFGYLDCSWSVFDQMGIRDVVSWNSIIAAYEQNCFPQEALRFFHEMKSNKVQPDLLTLVSLSSCLAQTKDFLCSKSVHGFVIRRCWIAKDTVIGNGIVDMYAKLGVIDSARRAFEQLPSKDVISWNTMITGFAQNGFASEAINLYRVMKENDNLKPNQGTWVSILPAYAHLGSLRDGMRIHCLVLKQNLEADVYVGTCLIDLYGKCGRLSEAMLLFKEVPRETSVTWNAVISCHGLHGLGQTCVQLFHDMLSTGVNPDEVTLLSLLTACSHSGLVDEGKRYFHSMEQEYGVKPTLKHYGCMVDLFGRAGLLEVAYNFVKTMPVWPDSSIWGALLGACRVHGNVEMGQKASGQLFMLDRENVGYYVLMSNIYANLGRWEGVGAVRSLARDQGLWKTPGWSSVELNNKLEVFYMASRSHPQSEDIYKELASLNSKLRNLGYIPDYSFVLQDVEDDEKENILSSHSERLAIVCGILNTPPKSSIRIYKNLRVCGDCHNVTKLISKVTEREIIVRDSNRFHHFRDGVCSCGDYW